MRIKESAFPPQEGVRSHGCACGACSLYCWLQEWRRSDPCTRFHTCLSLSALFRTESMCVNEQAHFLWSCWLFIQRFLSSLGTLEQLPLPPLTLEIRAQFWHTFFFSDTLFKVLGSYSLWDYSIGQNFETSFWIQCRGGPCMKKALEQEQAPRWELVMPRWHVCTFYESFSLVQLRHSADFPKCFRGQRSDFPRPLSRSAASWPFWAVLHRPFGHRSPSSDSG